MGSASSSPKRIPLVSESSSPEKMQLLFTPLILASEPGSTLTSSMLPGEILLKIGKLASVEAMRNLVATCKYIRNQLDTWFLQALASENNPDRATSGFIVDAIGDKSNTCLWRNATFSIKDHDIPKDLSIHLLTNTTTTKISSDEVRSMIIQVSGSPGSYVDIRKFLKFLFSKVSFKDLKCLMLCGIELSNDFSQEMGTLNLDVFHMRNFHYDADWAKNGFFCYCNSLKTLYIVHPDEGEVVYSPHELEKLVLYCPKSGKDPVNRSQLALEVWKCSVLKEM